MPSASGLIGRAAALFLGALVLAALSIPATADVLPLYTQETGQSLDNARFEVTCPDKTLMVGIDYRTGDVLNAIAGLCQSYDKIGTLSGKLYGTSGYGGDLNAGKSRSPIMCPDQTAVTELLVAFVSGWTIPDMVVICQTVRGLPNIRGGVTVSMFNTDSQKFYPTSYQTGPCGYGIGLFGHAGSTVTSIGIKCLLPDISRNGIPQNRPLTVDNGEAGNADKGNANKGNGDGGGGGATAATDTTIYDQPEGNDVAYLSSGDAVTIVSCNDNNWCRISKPKKGWVWGEDLSR